MTADNQRIYLDVGIIGAGVGGLITAIALRTHGHKQHRVTVFERHPGLQALGAPIQITPNGSKILIRYGLEDLMESIVPDIKTLTKIHSYKTGEKLTSMPAQDARKTSGAPIWTIARYRLVEALLNHAKSIGVRVHFNTPVSQIDTASEDPRLQTDDGEWHRFHLVIGADGMGSCVRKHILGREVRAANPCTAFSINIPRSLLRADPHLAMLLESATSWLGPGRLIVAIDMPDLGDVCNFIMASEHEEGEQGEWEIKGDISKVKERFADFEPRVHKFIDLADPNEIYVWKFSDLPPLETWRSENGRVLIVGDAAHAMLPNSAMGATCCIEDSECLAECLSHAKITADLPDVMAAFEAIRKPRTTFCAQAGLLSQNMACLPDGPEQEARDEMFRNPPRPPASSAPEQNDDKPKSPEPPRKLEDYDPPKTPGAVFMPEVRTYNLKYDVLDHTREYFKVAARNGATS